MDDSRIIFHGRTTARDLLASLMAIEPEFTQKVFWFRFATPVRFYGRHFRRIGVRFMLGDFGGEHYLRIRLFASTGRALWRASRILSDAEVAAFSVASHVKVLTFKEAHEFSGGERRSKLRRLAARLSKLTTPGLYCPDPVGVKAIGPISAVFSPADAGVIAALVREPSLSEKGSRFRATTPSRVNVDVWEERQGGAQGRRLLKFERTWLISDRSGRRQVGYCISFIISPTHFANVSRGIRAR